MGRNFHNRGFQPSVASVSVAPPAAGAAAIPPIVSTSATHPAAVLSATAPAVSASATPPAGGGAYCYAIPTAGINTPAAMDPRCARMTTYGIPAYGRTTVATNLYGIITNLYGRSINLYGIATNLYGVATKLHGIGTVLYGKAAKLDGKGSVLYGIATNFYGIVSNLYRIKSNLYRKASNLYEFTANLYGKVIFPESFWDILTINTYKPPYLIRFFNNLIQFSNFLRLEAIYMSASTPARATIRNFFIYKPYNLFYYEQF